MPDKRAQSNTNETESKETRSRGAFPRLSLAKALERVMDLTKESERRF